MHNSLFTLIRFLHIRFMQHIITLTNPDEIVIQRDRFAIYFFFRRLAREDIETFFNSSR